MTLDVEFRINKDGPLLVFPDDDNVTYEVRVTKDGSPVEGATVHIVLEDDNGRSYVYVAGFTNGDGTLMGTIGFMREFFCNTYNIYVRAFKYEDGREMSGISGETFRKHIAVKPRFRPSIFTASYGGNRYMSAVFYLEWPRRSPVFEGRVRLTLYLSDELIGTYESGIVPHHDPTSGSIEYLARFDIWIGDRDGPWRLEMEYIPP